MQKESVMCAILDNNSFATKHSSIFSSSFFLLHPLHWQGVIPMTTQWQWVFLGTRAGPWWCEIHSLTYLRSWCHAGLHACLPKSEHAHWSWYHPGIHACLPKSEHAHWSQAEQWSLPQSLEYHLYVWLSQLPYKSSSWPLASLSAGTLPFLLNPHLRNIGAIFSSLELICWTRRIFGSVWEKK